MRKKIFNILIIILLIIMVLSFINFIVLNVKYQSIDYLQISVQLLFIFSLVLMILKQTLKLSISKIIILLITFFTSIIQFLFKILFENNFEIINIFFIVCIGYLLMESIISFAKGYCNNENAIYFASKGKNRIAIFIYSKCIKFNSRNSDIYYSRGALYDKIGKYKKAEKDFIKSIEGNLPDARGYIALGIYKYENGETAEALKLFHNGINLDSTLVEYIPIKLKEKFIK